MKITRSNIKEMVNEVLSIIIEGRKPYDNLKANQEQQIINDKAPTKSTWTNFFLQNEKGIDATLNDAINYFKKAITPNNFNRQRCLFKANYKNIVKEKIDSVRQWFYSNGGENLNSENYQIGLCEIVKKYKSIFKASLGADILKKVDNSDELFYKFIKVILFTRHFNEHITELYKTNDMYLCFVAYKLLRSKEIIPTDIDTIENRQRFNNEYNFKQNIEHFEIGDNNTKTVPFCKTILSFLNIETSSRATSDNILLLVNR